MLALALAFQETLGPKERTDASTPKTLGRLVVVGRNKAFMAFLLIGAIGIFMVMLPFPDYIVAVGNLMTIGIAIALVGWYALLRSKLILRGAKDSEEPESLL